MAVKNLTENGNYIYMEQDGDVKNYVGAKKDVKMRIMKQFSPVNVWISGMIVAPNEVIGGNGLPITEYEIDGVAATEESMQAFIDANTANFNGGGTAPTSSLGYIEYNATENYVSGAQEFPLPPNTIVLTVYNETQDIYYTKGEGWITNTPEILTILASLDAADKINIVGLVATDVTPPTTQRCIIYIESQGATGFINPTVKRNTTGLNFEFTRTDVGTFSVSNFDSAIHAISARNLTNTREAYYSIEESVFYTEIANSANDTVFEFGGWIFIEQII